MKHRFRLAVFFVAGVLFAAASWPGTVAQAATTSPAMAGAAAASKPASDADCNGYSTTYSAVRPGLQALCTDPITIHANGTTGRFYDNGRYVGHDEPSVKFISNDPGSANNITYAMKLSTDPRLRPTVPGTRGPVVTDYAELSPAPWFGLPICDPNSYPLNPCTPDSDSNGSGINDPNAAGSAFMEMQFYPPGYQPFIDGPSCDATHWCAALTIDSLECSFDFAFCNPQCEEPVNFAYLQRDGVPAGPPAPLASDVSTFTPNRETLLMNPGDVLVVTMKDTPQGFLTAIQDLTTHQTGFMVASAANGFANSNPQTCANTPFSFHPEFSTAAQQNQVPWAALEGGVLMEDELGHFEACSSVTNSFPVGETAGSQTFDDPNVFQTCVGGSEGPGQVGEGPCTTDASGTTTCQNATTEGDTSCPNNSPGASLCEYSDAFCMPAGPRQINVNGRLEEVSWPIAGCQDDAFQNGDLDFDGTSYNADWPDGSPLHPTSFQYIGPFDANGRPYPQVQFESDVPASEADCNTTTGADCTALPAGAAFYPFWSLGRSGRGSCVWNFGNDIRGVTVNDFGGDAEYGTPDVARFGGTVTSPVLANPELGRGCGPISLQSALGQMG